MGIQQALFANSAIGSGVVVPIIGPWRMTVYGSYSTGRARFTYHRDGTISTTVDGSVSVGTVGGSRWYNPTTVDIGDSYWIRATASDVTGGGSNLNSGFGTWLQLSTDRFWEINLDDVVGGGESATKSTRILIEIATDAAGVSVVATSSDNALNGDYYGPLGA